MTLPPNPFDEAEIRADAGEKRAAHRYTAEEFGLSR